MIFKRQKKVFVCKLKRGQHPISNFSLYIILNTLQKINLHIRFILRCTLQQFIKIWWHDCSSMNFIYDKFRLIISAHSPKRSFISTLTIMETPEVQINYRASDLNNTFLFHLIATTEFFENDRIVSTKLVFLRTNSDDFYFYTFNVVTVNIY